jgi:hypothetical protein
VYRVYIPSLQCLNTPDTLDDPTSAGDLLVNREKHLGVGTTVPRTSMRPTKASFSPGVKVLIEGTADGVYTSAASVLLQRKGGELPDLNATAGLVSKLRGC